MAFAFCCVAALHASDRPWQQIVVPSAAEAAAGFRQPAVEYGPTVWWGWDGPVTEAVIARDLDGFLAHGIRSVTIEPGYNMTAAYLSPAWFQLIKTAVEQARQRGMRVWLVDEGKYPSGFAGGKISAEHPELRMQGLIPERIEVAGGETLARKLSPDTIGAIAVNQADHSTLALEAHSGELNWKAPEGKWQVIIVEHRFRSAPTRSVNNPTHGKDEKESVEDYLNPAATRQFLDYTEDQYAKVMGDEFGKTILGFRGDEPDYSIPGAPWTEGIFSEFERRKGYDVRPFVAAFFVPNPTDEQRRAKADYWDVWSALFRDGFFKPQGEWCAAHHLDYLVHLNHEDAMMHLVRSEGDFFRDMRYVQIPGIDTIWNQIWPGKVSDFPKYASSAAHVFGRPRAFTESFAAYRTPPTLEQARWVINQQFARGINMVELMFVPSSAARGTFALHGWMGDAEFPATANWMARASYLLTLGRPAARIAVYYPTMAEWLGDAEADKTTLDVMQQLLGEQRDFDFTDDDTLASAPVPKQYRAVVVPGATAMSRAAYDRLRAFGKVVFVGEAPKLIVGRSFLKDAKPADISWASRDLHSLPVSDVVLDHPISAVKYLHRVWKDADAYFFFNESDQRQSAKVTLESSGKLQCWDADTAAITDLPAGPLTLDLAPYQSKFIVVRK
jgi:hypothetical protein